MKNPNPDAIYDQDTFCEAFRKDLGEASAFVFIESAFITVDGVKRFSDVISRIVNRGVRVCVFIQRPKYWTQRHETGLDPSMRAGFKKIEAAVEFLESLGAHVNLLPGLHRKGAVIDYRITWKGSLNILSYTAQTVEDMCRWTNQGWARITVQRYGLERCVVCGKTVSNPLSIEFDNKQIGKQLADLRRNARISQDELAEAVGVSRATISDLESGKSSPKADLLARICSFHGKGLAIVPSDGMPIIARLFSPGGSS